MLFELLAGLLIVYALLKWNLLPHCITPSKFLHPLHAMPGPGIGFARHLPVKPEKVLEFSRNLFLSHGSPILVRVLWFDYVLIIDPEDMEVLLSSSTNIDKSREYTRLHSWLGLGLLTSTGERYISHRKLITPAFNTKILEECVQVFSDQSEVLVQKLTEQVTRGDTGLGNHVDLCILDNLCESIMRISINAQNKGHVEFITALKTVLETCSWRMYNFWLWNDYLFKFSPTYRKQQNAIKVVHAFSNKVIQERRKEYRAMGPVAETEEIFTRKRRQAFLDVLIEVSEKEGLLSDTDIREEVDTFLLGGYDTVATAVSFALYLLGHNPDIQDKVAEELRDIFGDSDRAVAYNDLQNMKYLEQVIKETLRLYPSLPVVARELKEDMKTNKYTIPAGTTVFAIFFFLHRNPRVFPDPEKFDPERFSPENVKGRHPYAFLPFSSGVRSCPGQRLAYLNMKTVLSSILRKFKVESLCKLEDMVPLPEMVIHPKEELKMKLSLRLFK